jgi:hypothetical protein
MNIERLKFAVARGARVQIRTGAEPEWRDHPSGYLGYRHADYRVHPDDAALEYGPLSAALKHRIVWSEWTEGAAAALIFARHLGFEQVHYASDAEHLHYWDFVAEYLADQGL